MVPASNELSMQSPALPVSPMSPTKSDQLSLRERLNQFWARLRQYG